MRGWVRGLEAVQALGEPLVALALAFLITLLATLPLILLPLRIELPLRPAALAVPAGDSLLLARIEALGIAEQASIARAETSGARLVLEGVRDPLRAVRETRAELDDAGFDKTWIWAAPELDVEDLLTADSATSVPRLLAIQAAAFTLVGAVLMRFRLRPSPGAVGEERAGWGTTVGLGLVGGAAAIVGSLLVALVLYAFGIEVEEQPWLTRLLGEPGATLRLAPWIVLVVPASEEVFFRGYLFRFVRERMGLASALAYSASVFAIIHMNPSGLPIYLVVGLVFGWVYQRTGRLLTPILAHALLNAFVLLVPELSGRS